MYIRKATINDSSEIAALMSFVYKNLEDKSLYVCDDLNYVITQLSGNGLGVVAVEDESIIGSLILRYPQNSPDNLVNDIGFPVSEQEKAVHFETCVVHPEYRGQGLQYKMMEFAKSLLNPNKTPHCLATVSPKNTASIKSCEKCGFKPVLLKEKYGGLLRFIMYMNLKENEK